MLQIISGFWISRAVYVIAKLGIPDLLKSGPKTADELASATNMHAPSLYRMLRALSERRRRSPRSRRFLLTPVSEPVRSPGPWLRSQSEWAGTLSAGAT